MVRAVYCPGKNALPDERVSGPSQGVNFNIISAIEDATGRHSQSDRIEPSVNAGVKVHHWPA